jgi:hypothetical protein
MAFAETAQLVASLNLKGNWAQQTKAAQGAFGRLGAVGGKVTSELSRGARNLTTNLARLGAIGIGALTTQVYAGVRSLEELERVTKQTEGLIASQGGTANTTAAEMRKLAESLEEVTTADDKAIQGGINLLIPYKEIGKEVFPQAAKATVDLAIAMAEGDTASADFAGTAKLLGKALSDPEKAAARLRRAGIVLTKDQEELIKSLAEAGKTAEAQGVILQALEERYGEAGRAAGEGFGGDLRRFQDAVEEAQKALAVGFLPLLSEVARVLKSELSKPETMNAIREGGKELAAAFKSILEIGSRVPWAQIGDAMRIAGTGARAILDAFASMPPWVQTAVITGWGLNRLTGGALGSIVGELGKGLVKGVLGINAGVVNIKAGTVVGAGGAGGTGAVAGGGGTLGKVVGAVTIVGAAASVLATWQETNEASSRTAEGLATLNQRFLSENQLSRAQLLNALAGVDQGIDKITSNPLLTLVQGDALNQLHAIRSQIVAQIGATDRASDRQASAVISTSAAVAATIRGTAANAAAQRAAIGERNAAAANRNATVISGAVTRSSDRQASAIATARSSITGAVTREGNQVAGAVTREGNQTASAVNRVHARLGTTNALLQSVANSGLGSRLGPGHGLQHGGIIPPYQTRLVGERAPEVLTAGRKALRVTPFGQAGAAPPVHVTVRSDWSLRDAARQQAARDAYTITRR